MKTYISLLTLVFLYTISFAQVLEPSDYEQKLSYTELETDYYLVDEKDIENLSMLDKVKMKELKTEREYTKYINANDERTTIIKHISSENIYQDWMEEPEVLLIDKNGVTQLTKSGEKVNYIEHSPTYLELSKNLGSDLLPLFVIPSREQKLLLKENGFQVLDLENGFTLIKSKNQEMMYNEELLYLEENQLNESGEVVRSRKVNFMQLPDGEIVHQRIRESQSEILENEIVAEHVFLRLFSNYRYENIYSHHYPKTEENIALTINTEANNTTITYDVFTNSDIINVTVFSMNGGVAKSFSSENNGRNSFDISELTPGIYVLRVESGGKTISEKFVKL